MKLLHLFAGSVAAQHSSPIQRCTACVDRAALPGSTLILPPAGGGVWLCLSLTTAIAHITFLSCHDPIIVCMELQQHRLPNAHADADERP